MIVMLDVLLLRRPLISTRAATLFPYSSLFRAVFNCASHFLRGFAALMVFSAHLLGGSAEHVSQDHSAYVQFVLRPWQFGVSGVYLFFTISGFVILPSVLRYSTGQFALRRFLRLYPLFLTLTLGSAGRRVGKECVSTCRTRGV